MYFVHFTWTNKDIMFKKYQNIRKCIILESFKNHSRLKIIRITRLRQKSMILKKRKVCIIPVNQAFIHIRMVVLVCSYNCTKSRCVRLIAVIQSCSCWEDNERKNQYSNRHDIIAANICDYWLGNNNYISRWQMNTLWYIYLCLLLTRASQLLGIKWK